MRYPKQLPEHGTIGFVAPSFGCVMEPYHTAFLNTQKKFKEMGHALDLGPNCYEEKGIGISNTPQACGEELTSYYTSVDNDILISCGGGELMCETIDYVDFEKIKKAEPKWFMGYSDNTNMTFLLTTLCDTAAIYGPCAAEFGREPWHESLMDAYEILRGTKHTVSGYDRWEIDELKSPERPYEPYNLTEKRELWLCQPAMGEEGNAPHKATAEECVEIEGRLLGGCMDCLINLLGTKYDKVEEFCENYKEDGIIWFLEACDLNVVSIRRAIWQMKNAGWFQHVKGFLIGRPGMYGQEAFGMNQYEAACALLKDLQVPILMDLDIGHLPPMMPLVSGSYAKIHTKGNDIRVDMIYK